ncbi:uncharacterized protein LOC143586538 isoform X2 [Bidens hawaiensis]|uniref:uncharacterized protein LOC143586538 isoform X2 n=1 Tax=Bidens hawaiensis TaxID=980011 RepID=UPI00404B8FA1
MLPLCSTTAAYYYQHPQVCLYGHRHTAAKCIMENNKLHHFLKLADINRSKPLHLPNTSFIIATNEPPEYLLKTDTAITNTFKTLQLASKGLHDSLDASLNNMKLSFSTTLSGLFNSSKGVSSKAGVIAVDGLRHVIVALEELLARGVTLVVYGYASVKDTLPPDLQSVLNSSEDYVLRPVGTAFQQVYIVFEGFEKSVGIDPTDPIVPFVILLGTSTTLWVSYWRLTYAGYAGDLSPKITLDLLNEKEGIALIDVRPEARGCNLF